MRQHTQTLCDLAKRNGWTNGAEIGVRRGGTTAGLLKLNPQLHMYAVDAWAPMTKPKQAYSQEQVDGFELDARARLSAFGKRCTIIKADSVAGAAQVPDGSLDFVFIDADHSADAVYADVLAWRPKLKPDGWLMGHDINWAGVRGGLERAGINWKIYPGNVWLAV